MDDLKGMLDGKVAIVTGASRPRGMGFASAEVLAANGARVVLTDFARNDDERAMLEQATAKVAASGASVMAIALDVTDKQQISDCIDETMDVFGRVDILFNNAGTAVGCGDFLALTDEQWNASYCINVKGTADFCRLAIPAMQRTGGGSIINNASLAGLGAIGFMAAYIASKFAVVGLTKAIAAEFGKDGIRCNAVCPGVIDTDMCEAEVARLVDTGMTKAEARESLVADVALGRWGQSTEVAQAVAFLAGPQAAFVTGVALPVAGGLAPGL